MARRSHNTLRTVRFYEESGILRPVRRTEGGHRLFEEAELHRLMLVTDLRIAGLPIEEIKHILAIKQSSQTGGEASREAVRMLGERIEELRSKLGVLTRLREEFARTSDVMTACMTCSDPKFPHDCEHCTVMSSHDDLPRSMRVLWASPKAEVLP